MNKRRCTFEVEQFFHSKVYMFKRKQGWLINMRSAGHLISVSAVKEHFDIYLHFSLNDRLLCLLFLSLCFARFHYKNCKNIKKIHWGFSSFFHYPAIAIRFTNKVHTRLQI